MGVFLSVFFFSRKTHGEDEITVFSPIISQFKGPLQARNYTFLSYSIRNTPGVSRFVYSTVRIVVVRKLDRLRKLMSNIQVKV